MSANFRDFEAELYEIKKETVEPLIGPILAEKVATNERGQNR